MDEINLIIDAARQYDWLGVALGVCLLVAGIIRYIRRPKLPAPPKE